jgi:sialic acid synthase SpsE
LCAARRLFAGHILQYDDVIALRPAVGLALDRMTGLVGRPLRRDVEEGSPLFDEDIVPHAAARLDRGVA